MLRRLLRLNKILNALNIFIHLSGKNKFYRFTGIFMITLAFRISIYIYINSFFALSHIFWLILNSKEQVMRLKLNLLIRGLIISCLFSSSAHAQHWRKSPVASTTFNYWRSSPYAGTTSWQWRYSALSSKYTESKLWLR